VAGEPGTATLRPTPRPSHPLEEPHASPWRARTALVLATTALIGLAACGGDDEATTSDGPVEVQSAGDESGRIQLPGSAEVGQAGSTSVMVDLSVKISGRGIDQEVPVTQDFDVDVEGDDQSMTMEMAVTVEVGPQES